VFAGTTGLGFAPAQPAVATATVNVQAKIRIIVDSCLDACLDACMVSSRVCGAHCNTARDRRPVTPGPTGAELAAAGGAAAPVCPFLLMKVAVRGGGRLARRLLDSCLMDLELAGLLIVTVVAVPYMVEILLQLPLLTRMIAALPPDVRARLGRHPHHPSLGVFGSTRFFVALFRYALRNDAGDTAEMTSLKQRARRSAIREGVFGLVLIMTIIVLWRAGWRPPWPRP
jgi:hypothetical protein